jgi:hypothetical protein
LPDVTKRKVLYFSRMRSMQARMCEPFTNPPPPIIKFSFSSTLTFLIACYISSMSWKMTWKMEALHPTEMSVNFC